MNPVGLLPAAQPTHQEGVWAIGNRDFNFSHRDRTWSVRQETMEAGKDRAIEALYRGACLRRSVRWICCCADTLVDSDRCYDVTPLGSTPSTDHHQIRPITDWDATYDACSYFHSLQVMFGAFPSLIDYLFGLAWGWDMSLAVALY